MAKNRGRKRKSESMPIVDQINLYAEVYSKDNRNESKPITREDDRMPCVDCGGD